VERTQFITAIRFLCPVPAFSKKRFRDVFSGRPTRARWPVSVVAFAAGLDPTGDPASI